MWTSTSIRRIHTLLASLRNETLIPNPEFQRRLVWSNKHKNDFIDTVLRGYPFPEIYIAAGEVDLVTGKGKEMLVDGQQRLTTLKQYFNASPDLKLSREITPYTELKEEKKRAFLNYEVVVRDLGQMSVTEMKEIFQRINSTNYSLNAMEIRHARFDGEIKKFAEKLAQDPFFEERRVFRASEIRRMNDTAFTLSVIITIMSTYFNLDHVFEDYLFQYNDEFKEKDRLEVEFQKVFQFVSACRLPQSSRPWRTKSDLFTLLVEVYEALIKNGGPFKPAEVGKRLRKFYELVDELGERNSEIENQNSRIAEYYTAVRQATNHRTSRINRGEILRDVIKGEFVFGGKQD